MDTVAEHAAGSRMVWQAGVRLEPRANALKVNLQLRVNLLLYGRPL